MASTVWKGYLSFGLVSIPVRLLRAARAERVNLRQLHRQHEISAPQPPEAPVRPLPPPLPIDRAATRHLEAVPATDVALVRRIYQPANSDADAEPIPQSDLVKGYQYEPGQYVILEEQDLRGLAPQTSSEMQIVEFVRFSEIDPVYLETSYYLTPDETGEKAYALLLEAMRATGYAAVGQLTMHRRDHVVIVRPGKTGLIAHTMFYPDEVRSTEEFRTDTTLATTKELDLAKSLIQALAKPFEPTRFKNVFRERLAQLIDSRIKNQQTARMEASTPAPKQVIDIMEALQRSLAEARSPAQPSQPDLMTTRRKPATGEPTQERRRTRAAPPKRR